MKIKCRDCGYEFITTTLSNNYKYRLCEHCYTDTEEWNDEDDEDE